MFTFSFTLDEVFYITGFNHLENMCSSDLTARPWAVGSMQPCIAAINLVSKVLLPHMGVETGIRLRL